VTRLASIARYRARMAVDRGTRALTDEQLAEVLELTKGADSIELKLTVPDTQQRSTVQALGIDPLDVQMRQVFFFDTPDLKLNANGLVVRGRRVQGKGDDSVIKLRPVKPADLPAEYRASPNMVVEIDAMPGGYVCSATMKARHDATAVRAVHQGAKPIRSIFSKEQRAFFKGHAPDGIELDDLTLLGPIPVMKVRFVPEGFGRKLVAELWQYPDGSRILELSTKALPNEAFQVATEARLFLKSKGVDLTGDQQTKTKTALEFFASPATES
jgi:hypothetical protein